MQTILHFISSKDLLIFLSTDIPSKSDIHSPVTMVKGDKRGSQRSDSGKSAILARNNCR